MIQCRAARPNPRAADQEPAVDFHFPQAFETIAAAIPDRTAVVFRDRRLTFAELRDRSRRLASAC